MSFDTISNILAYLKLASFFVYLGTFGSLLYWSGMNEQEALGTALSLLEIDTG